MGRSFKYDIREKSMKVVIVTDEQFNNKNQFKIYRADKDGKKLVEFDRTTGQPKDKKPMFNFGIEKAKVLLDNVDHLKNYIADNS